MLDREDASPELRVLLAAAGSAAGVASGYAERSSSADAVDWHRTERLARRHGLLPALHWFLEESPDREENPALDPPAELRESLAEAATETKRRNLHFAGLLHRIVDAFDEAGVRAVPIKGPIVAVLGYGDLGRRTFTDLDLLVVPEDLPEAATALLDDGYSLATDLGPHDFESAANLRDAPLFPHDLAFLSEGGAEVELCVVHGDLFGDGTLAIEALWENRTTVDVAGQSCPALSPTDRLVVLANHGSKHVWRRLEWLSGLAAVARHTDGDWETARERARDRNTLREFDLGALLAAEVFDAPVPDSVQRAARSEARVVDVADTILDGLIEDPLAFPGKLEVQRLRGKLRGDLPMRYLRFATRPTTADYRALPLPEPLWPVYRLVRPIRGVVKTLRS